MAVRADSESTCRSRRAAPAARDRSRATPSAEGAVVALARSIRPKLLGERELQVLLGGAHLFDVSVAGACEVFEHLLDQHIGHRGSAGDAHGLDALEPGLLDLVGVVDAV